MPNSPVDLTSLLDVIFIFLFFVIIGYTVAKSNSEEIAENAQKDLNTAKQDLIERQEKIDKLQKQNEQLIKDNSALSATNTHYADIQAAYEGEVVGQRVKIIVISCPYGIIKEDSEYEDDPTRSRVIMVDAPDFEFDNIYFNSIGDSEGKAFELLKERICGYIERIKAQNTTDDKNDKPIIVLYVKKTDKILNRDETTIRKIISELEEKYADVY